MAHNVRIRPDPNWVLGKPWLSSEQSTLDDNLSSAMNGDGGGLGAPTSNIVLGGAGLRLIGTTHTIAGAASAVTTDGATKLLEHGDSDYCELGVGHSGATQTSVSPISLGFASVPWIETNLGQSQFLFLLAPSLGATWRVPLDVHNGAVLASVALPWTVSATGSPGGLNTVPSQMPQLGIFAKDMYGTVYPLCVATPYQRIPTPATPTAFYASGATQTFTFTCDAADVNPFVTIDTARYVYFAQLVEMTGYPIVGVAGYGDLTATFTNISNIAPR